MQKGLGCTPPRQLWGVAGRSLGGAEQEQREVQHGGIIGGDGASSSDALRSGHGWNRALKAQLSGKELQSLKGLGSVQGSPQQAATEVSY